MKKMRSLELAFSLAALNFGGVFASNQLNHQNDEWARLTSVPFINKKTAQNIKEFCDELPLNPDDFLSLLNSVRALPDTASPEDCSRVQRGLIKFCPDISKSKIETIIKTDIAQLSQNFLKDPIKNAKDLAKREANQKKLMMRSPTAPDPRTVVDAIETETFLRESAERNNCCLADREIIDTLEHISNLKKIHDRVISLVVNKRQYPSMTFSEKLKKLKNDLFNCLIQNRELAAILTTMHKTSHPYLVGMQNEDRLVFCEVSERYIHEYLEKQQPNTLNRYTWNDQTTVFYDDTGLLLSRDLLDSTAPVFRINEYLIYVLLKDKANDQTIDKILLNNCYATTCLETRDHAIVDVKSLHQEMPENCILSLFQNLKTQGGRDELVDHIEYESNNHSTTVYLKDGNILQITPCLDDDLIGIADPDTENNWWDLLDTNFKFTDHLGEYNIAFTLNNSTRLLYKGPLSKDELFSFVETIRTTKHNDAQIKNIRIHNNNKVFIKLINDQTLNIDSLFAEIKITPNNWKLLLGKEKLTNTHVAIMKE